MEPIPRNNFQAPYIHRWLCARGALRTRDVNFGSLNNEEGRIGSDVRIANDANAGLDTRIYAIIVTEEEGSELPAGRGTAGRSRDVRPCSDMR
jgi:hypothetical protein